MIILPFLIWDQAMAYANWFATTGGRCAIHRIGGYWTAQHF